MLLVILLLDVEVQLRLLLLNLLLRCRSAVLDMSEELPEVHTSGAQRLWPLSRCMAEGRIRCRRKRLWLLEELLWLLMLNRRLRMRFVQVEECVDGVRRLLGRRCDTLGTERRGLLRLCMRPCRQRFHVVEIGCARSCGGRGVHDGRLTLHRVRHCGRRSAVDVAGAAGC